MFNNIGLIAACNDQECQIQSSMKENVITNSMDIDSQSRATAGQSGFYDMVTSKAHDPDFTKYMNNQAQAGGAAQCIGDVTGYMSNGVYYSCDGQNKTDSNQDVCTTQKVCTHWEFEDNSAMLGANAYTKECELSAHIVMVNGKAQIKYQEKC